MHDCQFGETMSLHRLIQSILVIFALAIVGGCNMQKDQIPACVVVTIVNTISDNSNNSCNGIGFFVYQGHGETFLISIAEAKSGRVEKIFEIVDNESKELGENYTCHERFLNIRNKNRVLLHSFQYKPR